MSGQDGLTTHRANPSGRNLDRGLVFLRGSPDRRSLTLGGDRYAYLSFTYIACELAELPYHAYRESDNLVARLNLPNMRYAPEDRVAVYADAVRGLTTLEADPELQLKYMDFIDIYAALDENEQQRYHQQYPEEVAAMTSFAERFTAIGEQRGEATMLLLLLRHKFGDLADSTRQRVETADPDTLLTWSERILTADSIDEILH
ncbi:transposase [uncultured Thiodictyon sp.]|uniref:transposase n=1 Tax=uncultured Thiodictyon sp. TaxID=1846217 RepID=UPI0025EF3F63|nr:transposase [uncultured Thiodictyon sp.]